MEESVEDILYRLKIGENSQPILTSDGWYIFKLVNRSDELLASENSKDDAIKNVRKIIEARKLIEQQKEFYEEFFKDKKIDVDSQIFESIAKKYHRFLNIKKLHLLLMIMN